MARTGNKPTVLTVDDESKKQRWKWRKSPGSYTDDDKKRLLGKVMEVMVVATFKYHTFKWHDKILR